MADLTCSTRRWVIEHSGLTYESDYYGDELAFWQTVQGDSRNRLTQLAISKR